MAVTGTPLVPPETTRDHRDNLITSTRQTHILTLIINQLARVISEVSPAPLSSLSPRGDFLSQHHLGIPVCFYPFYLFHVTPLPFMLEHCVPASRSAAPLSLAPWATAGYRVRFAHK
ncbi:hypothetical protein E2C01_026926 [Portunus trituberculatus]|uniref:Uncharacterized protein n=1 Tax=Portunus trituberculatus TaxID=210409 RepID=A0A5B7EGT1_PORTR|nr:hypothetical protein [Portunus trituberculatus]